MWISRLALATLALAASLTACGGDDESAAEPSSACLEAFRAMAAIPIGGDTSGADRATLTECKSYDEWIAAAIQNPKATGFTADGIRTESNQRVAIQVSCGTDDPDHETQVCSDAAEQGLLKP